MSQHCIRRRRRRGVWGVYGRRPRCSQGPGGRLASWLRSQAPYLLQRCLLPQCTLKPGPDITVAQPQSFHKAGVPHIGAALTHTVAMEPQGPTLPPGDPGFLSHQAFAASRFPVFLRGGGGGGGEITELSSYYCFIARPSRYPTLRHPKHRSMNTFRHVFSSQAPQSGLFPNPPSIVLSPPRTSVFGSSSATHCDEGFHCCVDVS